MAGNREKPSLDPDMPYWLRLLPAFVLRKIERRPNLIKAVSNTGWLFGDRALRMGVGLFVGVWVARYLGPEQFGILSYGMAFVALFGTVAALGLNTIVVRDLVRTPDKAYDILGSSFVLQILGGVFATLFSVLAVMLVRPDDELVLILIAILGSALVFKSSDVIKYWFESQVQSKYAVWVENGAFLLFSCLKIVLIYVQASIIYFASVVLLESMAVFIGLFIVYVRRGFLVTQWKCSFERGLSLLRDGWPLILSGLAVSIYMRIDQIMLGSMLGDEVVGIYSAAVRVSEAWYFIPVAIVASVFPSIIAAKNTSQEMYAARLQKLYALMVFLGLVAAVPVTFLSDSIMVTLFGEKYRQSGLLLSIHIWTGVFAFLGVASGRWFVLEGLQRIALNRTLGGAVINVALNYILIPKFAAVGAAVATVIANIFAAFIYDYFHMKTRNQFYMKARSLLLIYRGRNA